MSSRPILRRAGVLLGAIAFANVGAGCALLVGADFDDKTVIGDGSGAADSSFEARCSAAGVVRCFGFDAPDALIDRYEAPSGVPRATIDAEMKLSGTGALRFDVPANAADDDLVGRFSLNASDDFSQLFGSGETLYVQWRQRFDRAFLEGDFGGLGWRQAIIGLADRFGLPASELDSPGVVMANYYYKALPLMSTAGGQPFESPAPLGGVFLQNEVRCTSEQIKEPPCVLYAPDEWMTFQIAVTLGMPSAASDHVEAWVGHEGRASLKILDVPGVNLGATSADHKLGKVWFSLNETSPEKSSAPSSSVWIDELVMSREPVAEP